MQDTLIGPAFEVVSLPDRSPRVVLLRVVADLDLATAPATERQLETISGGEPLICAVVVDFGLDDFVCVRGVGMLLDLTRRLHSWGGRLLFCGPPPGLRRLVEILDLDGDIEIVDTVDDALRAVGG